MQHPDSRNGIDSTKLVAALALALAAMSLPTAVQAGPSREVADALHGHTDTDRVALDRIERLAGRDVDGDLLDAHPWSSTAEPPRRASGVSRETTTSDAYPWQTLTRSRETAQAQARDGRVRGEGQGRQDGRGREDRDGRGGHEGHDRHDADDVRGGHHGHHGHHDRDDFELGEHEDGEGHFHGSDTPVSPVPVPAAGWLLALGLLGLAGSRRRTATRATAGAAAA